MIGGVLMREVFYLITELDVGGAERTLYELATRLDRTRFAPTVGCLTGRGPLGRRLEEKGVEVIYFDMRSAFDVGAWKRLRRTLRERKPDILHTFLFHANFVGRLAARGSDIEKVISAVRVEEPRWTHLWGERLTRRWVDVVTCVSESARLFTHEKTGYPLDKLVTIPNGIDVARFDEQVAVPAEWNLPTDAPVVAVIGRLDDQKDPLLMLKAARLVRERAPKVVFAFAGDGPLASACRGRSEEMGLGGGVRWLGWIPDVRALLQRAACLALSSRWEGMPNAVLESMAAGIPAAAFGVGGTSELIVHNSTGLLTTPGDIAALGSAIYELITNPGRAGRMGARARIRAERSFSLEQMVSANQALYG